MADITQLIVQQYQGKLEQIDDYMEQLKREVKIVLLKDPQFAPRISWTIGQSEIKPIKFRNDLQEFFQFVEEKYTQYKFAKYLILIKMIFKYAHDGKFSGEMKDLYKNIASHMLTSIVPLRCQHCQIALVYPPPSERVSLLQARSHDVRCIRPLKCLKCFVRHCDKCRPQSESCKYRYDRHNFREDSLFGHLEGLMYIIAQWGQPHREIKLTKMMQEILQILFGYIKLRRFYIPQPDQHFTKYFDQLGMISALKYRLLQHDRGDKIVPCIGKHTTSPDIYYVYQPRTGHLKMILSPIYKIIRTKFRSIIF